MIIKMAMVMMMVVMMLVMTMVMVMIIMVIVFHTLIIVIQSLSRWVWSVQGDPQQPSFFYK